MNFWRIRLFIVYVMMLGSPFLVSRTSAESLTGPVGVDNPDPKATLEVSSTVNPSFRLSENASITQYFQIQDFGGGTATMSLSGDTSSQVQFDPIVRNHTGAAYFKFFRLTNTAGPRGIAICRGNGQNIVDTYLGVGGGATFFTNTRVGIGTASPTAGYSLDIVGKAKIDNADVSGNVVVTGETTTSVLNITGGADFAERFTVAGDTVKPGMVVCIDPKAPGCLKISDSANDTCVAGIISGAGGVHPGIILSHEKTIASGQYPVALHGRTYCMVDADQGAIIPGDLLTTSGLAGHAMKVKDHSAASGAIIGKAMTPLAKGQGLVLVLISMQ